MKSMITAIFLFTTSLFLLASEPKEHLFKRQLSTWPAMDELKTAIQNGDQDFLVKNLTDRAPDSLVNQYGLICLAPNEEIVNLLIENFKKLWETKIVVDARSVLLVTLTDLKRIQQSGVNSPGNLDHQFLKMLWYIKSCLLSSDQIKGNSDSQVKALSLPDSSQMTLKDLTVHYLQQNDLSTTQRDLQEVIATRQRQEIVWPNLDRH